MISRKGLPLFMLTFDREETERVHNIRSILNMKVKIEPLQKTSDLIPCAKDVKVTTTRKGIALEKQGVSNDLTNILPGTVR